MHATADDAHLLSLFEAVERECNFFLNNCDEKAPLVVAAEMFAPILNYASQITKANAGDIPKGIEMMLELANRKVERHGESVCARVGVSPSGDLLITFTPVGCEGQHFLAGLDVKPITFNDLDQFGFTPHHIALSLSRFANEIVVYSMITMRGGEA